MNKLYCILFCLITTSNVLSQQGIKTTQGSTSENLVKNVFLKGNCKNVSNINSIGTDPASIGQFSNGGEVITFDDGIIITTGKIDFAHGPNISVDSGFAFDETPTTDPDLSLIGTDLLFDVRGIEFDFIPLDEFVLFKYIFASEEYCEYVGSSFNDVFGFFVSGPGINGTYSNNAINVAKLAGTNTDVSINNVNHLQNTNLYIRNELIIDGLFCDLEFNPQYHELIEYDGFTVPLTATIPVIPCETYHIRLVIGDVGDANLDSAVLLEAKSFDLREKATFYADVPGNTEAIAYEACLDGQFVFVRNESTSINETCTINFEISSESTAINGEDFETIPLNITIPAGETQAFLPITIIEDNIIEGPEILKLEYVYDCECFNPIISELIISEVSEISVAIEDQLACAGQSFVLKPEINGGVPPYELAWENNVTSDSIEVSPIESTIYSALINDQCGNSQIVDFSVNIQNLPTASITGDFDLCDIKDSGIPVELEGSAPWTISYSIDEIPHGTIENIQSSPYFLPVTSEGIYELSSLFDDNCTGTPIGTANITNSSITFETILTPPSCINTFDGSIEILNIETSDPFNISWNIDTDDNLILDNLAEGMYNLMIENNDGCIYEESFDLFASANELSECSPIYIPNIFTPDSNDGNELFSIYIGTNSGVESINSLQIFDRWGSMVYKRNNFNPDNGTTGWDGEFNGQALSNGVYVYKIEMSFIDGSSRLRTGSISLIR